MENIMKKTILTLVFAMTASIATAQNLNLDRTGAYAGINLGTVTDSGDRTMVGGVVGYQVKPYARVEGTYDYANSTNGTGHALMVNAVPQYRIPGTVVTPYAVVGLGYAWDGLGKANGDGATVYNLGVGARVSISASWELDARYRYMNKFDNDFSQGETQLVSVGAAYRF
jgi:opacity protein-like surface antigen